MFKDEENRFENFTRPPEDPTARGYVFFYAMSFSRDGRLIVAFIRNDDRTTIRIMLHDSDTNTWTDAPSIHASELPTTDNMTFYFNDGLKMTRDRNNITYMYFKTLRFTYFFRENIPWAKLWVLRFLPDDMSSYEIYLTLDELYGTLSSNRNEEQEDLTLGHFVFDNYSEHL